MPSLENQDQVRAVTNPPHGVTWRLGLTILLLSLAPRLAALAVFSNYKVPPVYDEGGYFIRADGAARAAASCLALDRDGLRSGLYNWFGGGKWPPLYTLMLSLGFPLCEDNVVGARLINVFFSAATSILVFMLSLQMTGKRPVALAVTALHILHPTIIAYSVLLWSESAFTFFLVLSCYFALRGLHVADDYEKRKEYLFSGIALGTTALVRAASLPLLFGLPLLILWLERKRGRSFAARQAAWFFMAQVIVVLPYQTVICAFQGKFVLLSTASDYNLYLGNNPWVPLENGSSWGDDESKSKVHRMMATGDVAGKMAREEIVGHPGRFLLRSIFRLRMLWTPDIFPIRHVLSASAPPAYPAALLLLVVATLIAFVFVLGWGIFGFLTASDLRPGVQLLMLGVAAGLTIGPVATIGISRLHFPLTVLLLPYAVLGTMVPTRPITAPRVVAALFSVGFVVFALSSIPVTFARHLMPSSYYSAWLTPIGNTLERDLRYRDLIVIRLASDAEATDLALSIDPQLCQASLLGPYTASGGWETKKVASRHHFNEAGFIQTRLRPGDEIEVAISGVDLIAPVELAVEAPGSKEFKTDLSPEVWKRLQATPIPGVSYRWD